MPARSLKARILAAAPESLREAVAILRAGGLVVFPTDTVYGLGADPFNAEAVARIYRVKGREETKPLQLLLADASQLPDVATEVSELARRAAEHFFPGGITLVLKKAPKVPSNVVAGGETVGVRVPDHPLCRALVQAFRAPIAATSANRSGQASPRTAQEAAEQVGDAADLILDGGACPVGRESTVLDLSSQRPRLMRPGAVSKETIERVLGVTLDPSR